jgi:HSP20 family protein
MGAELEKRQKREVDSTAAEQMDQSGPSYSPDVDIYADDDKLLLAVDLPGVAKGDVAIQVDENNALVVRARNSFAEQAEPVLRQFNVGDFYRAFQLSDDFDKDKISAKLENGVLELTVPKREEVKPRRIEIKA